MPTLKPWPILTLEVVGGPDDGEVCLVPTAQSVVPRERLDGVQLEASMGRPRAYVRRPEMAAPWRYLWISEASGDSDG